MRRGEPFLAPLPDAALHANDSGQPATSRGTPRSERCGCGPFEATDAEKRAFLKDFLTRRHQGADGGLPEQYLRGYQPKLTGWTADVLNEELLTRYTD